jgi:hypothetical protein
MAEQVRSRDISRITLVILGWLSFALELVFAGSWLSIPFKVVASPDYSRTCA